MRRVLGALPAVMLLILIAIFLYASYWLARSFLIYLSSIPKELAATLVAGGTTVFAATLTVVLGRYFERKKELDALYRDKKIEIYDEFLKKYFDQSFSTSEHSPTVEPADLVAYFREFIRKIILWSGPQVIISFIKWKNYLSENPPDARMIFLTEEFFLAVRRDLRHSNFGIPKGFWAQLTLSEHALFLAEVKKNPDIKLSDLAELERTLKEKRGV